MVDEAIAEYVQDGIQRGHNITSMREALINQGWDISQVDDAITYVQGYNPEVSVVQKSSSNTRLFVIVGTISAMIIMIWAIILLIMSEAA